MEKFCVICDNDGKYKCPTCLVYYCSVQCCQKHREQKCDVLLKTEVETSTSSSRAPIKYTSEDTVPLQKLQLLAGNSNLEELLRNPHLRNLLTTVNNAENPEKIMEMAMQEPLFVEFADVCLRIVEPDK